MVFQEALAECFIGLLHLTATQTQALEEETTQIQALWEELELRPQGRKTQPIRLGEKKNAALDTGQEGAQTQTPVKKE